METAKTLAFNPSPLGDLVDVYLEKQGNSKAGLAREIGYSRTTLSRYLGGSYDSDSKEIEQALLDFFSNTKSSTTQRDVLRGKKVQFFENNDSRAIIGVCEASQEYIGLGMIVGNSGYGKTYALKHYAKLPHVVYIECDDTMSSRDLVGALERALGLPRISGSIHERANCIKDFCNFNKGYLIVIDEADKLISKNTIKKLEILRAIYDQSDVGLVLAGEPRLEVLIKNYDARMANRIDFHARLNGLSVQEVDSYLSAYDITEDAMSELRARACGTRSGCFRLLDRTLSNVWRLLQDNTDKKISSKTIERASAIMML